MLCGDGALGGENPYGCSNPKIRLRGGALTIECAAPGLAPPEKKPKRDTKPKPVMPPVPPEIIEAIEDALDSEDTFYRAGTLYDLERLRDDPVYAVKAIAGRQHGRAMDPGLYTSRNKEVAKYFYYTGDTGYGKAQGGPALMTIVIKHQDFVRLRLWYGVIDNRPVFIKESEGVPPPHVETLFPLESVPELMAKAAVTIEPLPAPPIYRR